MRALPLAVTGLLLAAPLVAQQAPAGKLARSIERLYGKGCRVDSVALDGETVLRLSRADSLLGFATVRNSLGKDQPITYLVAVDPADQLKDVDILAYREAYGGEVAYEAWRKQFRGKGADAPLEVGRDIRNISGATISAHSVTQGVREAVAQLTTWHREGRLK
jgi:Na+-translocating ferredoxin:NAD+ oxidoreductase RnfG subunit